jgi:hypothetical protein
MNNLPVIIGLILLLAYCSNGVSYSGKGGGLSGQPMDSTEAIMGF